MVQTTLECRAVHLRGSEYLGSEGELITPRAPTSLHSQVALRVACTSTDGQAVTQVWSEPQEQGPFTCMGSGQLFPQYPVLQDKFQMTKHEVSRFWFSVSSRALEAEMKAGHVPTTPQACRRDSQVVSQDSTIGVPHPQGAA